MHKEQKERGQRKKKKSRNLELVAPKSPNGRPELLNRHKTQHNTGLFPHLWSVLMCKGLQIDKLKGHRVTKDDVPDLMHRKVRIPDPPGDRRPPLFFQSPIIKRSCNSQENPRKRLT